MLVSAQPSEPLLVTYVGEKGKDYYLIPMQDLSTGLFSVFVRLDVYGNYLASLLIPPNKFPFKQSTQIEQSQRNAVIDMVRQQLLSMAAKWGKSPQTAASWLQSFVKELDNPKAILQWKPYQESRSAFFPFYVVNGEGGTTFYVRTDGVVFENLS